MIAIITHRSKSNANHRRIEQRILVSEDATPGSWGSHQLLIQEYKQLDESWLCKMPEEQFKQLQFNFAWLEQMLHQHGELHCEYCGKSLKLFHWKQKPDRKVVATTDHFLPKSKYPELRYEISNLLVACEPCNANMKGSNEVSRELIKFPYSR